ncbi:hypothetical protein AVKW3434_09280 [Acidovorax sp. SUPP3434]|uniref:hypothetical protein n=1 Tax=Acidovorax sp. SUPP3434 TaxID=2920880 RepID=UPI0023DE1F07|nr:hypothetical protein [Acidovorax sp. SUPP3434]GKS99566.1 hypothetical protein AVKW3434_09280 [Acidovorax sp. SUPP3434]
MPRHRLRWIALGATAVALACAAALAIWWPSEAELARRAGDAATERLGVPVQVGQLHWSLFPSPRIELRDVRTEQEAPLSAGRLSAGVRWGDLLHRRLALTDLQLENATIPQASLSDFQVRPTDGGAESSLPFTLAPIPVERADWQGVRWIGRNGRTLVYAGSAEFDTAWRPRQAWLERAGAPVPTRMAIAREGAEDRWRADVSAGGRTEQGTLRLQEINGRYRVTGAIDFTGVDVEGVMAAFERRAVVAGKASGHTDLIAEGADPAEAVQALHTRTRFTVARARLLTFDLERAVKTVGTQRGGTTQLDSLEGVVRTEADRGGTIVRYSDLKATSGVLTATGDAVLQNRRVSGHVAVDLVDGVVGIPLEFGGTMDDTTLTLPPAALAGAAVGTAVAPGVGTAIGARIGETLRRIFGGDEPEVPPPKRPAARH